MLRHVLGISLGFIIAIITACGSSSTKDSADTDTDTLDYTDDEYDLEVDVDGEGDAEDGPTDWVSDDTYEYTHGMHVDVGDMGDSVAAVDEKGTEIEYVERVQMVEKGGLQSLALTDKTTGITRTIEYNPALSSIAFIDGADRAVVVQNPDKSYSVDGAAAANGKAAVVLLKGKPPYADASPAMIMSAFTIAQHAAPEFTRACIGPTKAPSVPTGSSAHAASPPPVCMIFKDFCDCVACDKSGKTSCPNCP